ncbi:NAD(P)/FAD-dependent oxidoreductase [Pseudonocardia sp. CA-107938]|uniref:NAD(P)/FAD-dependent oxidoreductase n=1 Tax=Pseudonocardia sp. CA-107938 TaxID=3240021 RepID=UPI003D9235D0
MGMPDVVVVGGGIAGASVAYELAAHRSVVLLEAESVAGRHSTARSAATWVPGHGVADVRALVAASGPRFARLADELGTPPLLLPRQVLFVAVDDESERGLAGYLAERVGGPGAAARIDGTEAERLCPALAPGTVRAAGVVEGADVDTDALHQGYLRGLRGRGGEVRVGAPAGRIERAGSGWRVHYGDTVLDTALVVDAAGAWADVVAERAGVPQLGLVPYRRTIALARVPDPARLRGPAERLPFVIEAADRFYFKADGDDLMCSPVDETPTEPGDAKPDPLDVALALERVEEATRLGLRSVRTSWAGLRSFVADRRPVVGEWPGLPGFAFVAAQGGSGIETAPALSAYAAAVLTGQRPPADTPQDPALFAPDRELSRVT